MKLFYGGLVGRFRKKVRPAVSPATRPTSLPAASARIAQAVPQKLEVKQSRKAAPASTVRTEPTESTRSKVSGSKVGARMKKSSKNTTIPDTPDVIIPLKDTHIRGNFSTSVISFEDPGNSPPGPIELSYEVCQNGSSKRLAQYKKMYNGSTYELPTPSLVVGGNQAQAGQKLQPSTMAGFGRSNVHWPFAWHDYVLPGGKQLTSKMACFTRTQILDCFTAIWGPWGSTVDINLLIKQLEASVGGNERIDWPLDYIECEYTYLNNNVGLPAELTLYLCQPTKNLTATHSPMSDWIYPWGGTLVSGPELMDPSYAYNPVLTASEKVMFDYPTTPGTIGNVNMVAQASSVLTASTEIVHEATPQGFSTKFRRNWDVAHVKKIVLQPQQELKLTLRVKMSQLFDFKKFLSYDSGQEKFELFEGLSIFPMLKYKGFETTAVSSGLKRDAGITRQNRFLTTTAPRSGPVMISTGMKCRMRCNVKSVPPAGSPTGVVGSPTVSDVLDTFAVSRRDLMSYNDVERGQQMPYYSVNDNLGYFSDLGTKPTAQEYYTQLVELNVKGLPSAQSFPDTDATILQANLVTLNSTDNWNQLDVKTTSRNQVVSAEADIKIN